MSKKKYYGIGAVLVLIMTITSIIIEDNITKVAFAQDKKEVLKEKTQFSDNRGLVTKRLKEEGNKAAIRTAEEYLVSNPNDIDTINLLVETYINKDDLSNAEATVKRGIAVQRNNPWSRRLLARIYRIKSEKDPNLRNDNLALALEQVKIGLGSNPNDVGLLSEAAQIYSEQGDKNKANQTINRALGIAPNDAHLKDMKEAINAPKKIKK